MSRRIDIDLEGGLLRISFGYDAIVVNVVKSLPDRTYVSERKCWTVPIAYWAEVMEKLDPLRFALSPEMRTFWESQGALIPQVDRATGWSISALNAQVAGALAKTFPDPVWVIGELAGYEKGRGKRHIHFDLVERRGSHVSSKVHALAFESSRRQIARTLRGAGTFEFADGVEVRLLVRVELYAASGSYQISVLDIDPEYTISKIKAERKRILLKLEAEGVRALNQSIPLPLAPSRVVLITSKGSDAEADFVHELEGAGYAIQLTIIDARMQGRDLEPTILAALNWVATRDFDLCVISRGGGATTDLSQFDSEAIGRAICLLKTKVIVGVGHQKDTCVLDDVAHSVKTPTAAAQLIIETLDSTASRLTTYSELLSASLIAQVAQAAQRVREAGGRTRLVAERKTHRSQHRLQRVAMNLHARAQMMTESAALQLEHARLDRLRREVRRAPVVASRALMSLDDRVRLLDPTKVLERGFAIIRQDGRVVHRAESLVAGTPLVVEFADGQIVVDQKERDE